MRKVMIAAPSHDGRLSVWHAAALSETAKLGVALDINVVAIYMSFDSLVQRARNDIVAMALQHDFDDLVFIDTDQDWQPEDFFQLLEHDVDVVGAPVRKKQDVESYNVKLLGDYAVNENGLVEVDGVGTGFLRIRKAALEKVWAVSEVYREAHKTHESRMVFDVKLIDGEIWAEDIVFCKKWRDLGGTVWIDPAIDSGHSGEKRWTGNFSHWIESRKPMRFGDRPVKILR